MFDPCPSWDKLMHEIGRLKLAYELLYEVWGEVGGYNKVHDLKRQIALSRELSQKLNDFFGFDDSE